MNHREDAGVAMECDITIESPGARSMPATDHAHDDGAPCPSCPVLPRPPEQGAKGSETRLVRCPTHGIAFDSERETCPECAKPAPP